MDWEKGAKVGILDDLRAHLAWGQDLGYLSPDSGL